MLIFTDELKQKPLFFLKFANDLQRSESLQKGNLYMNTLRYFKELEKKTKEKGMGDENEGSMILSELNLKFYKHQTEELILEGKSSRSEIVIEEDLQKHLFCFYYLDFGSLEIIEETEGSVTTLLKFTENQKEELIRSFGKHVIVISCNDFIDNVRIAFEKENIEWTTGKVKYSDYSINYTDRIEDFIYDRNEKYFWKDKYFENQKEFRLVVLNRDSNIPIELNIGDLTCCSFITNTEKLFNDEYCIKIGFDPEKDLVKLED